MDGKVSLFATKDGLVGKLARRFKLKPKILTFLNCHNSSALYCHLCMYFHVILCEVISCNNITFYKAYWTNLYNSTKGRVDTFDQIIYTYVWLTKHILILWFYCKKVPEYMSGENIYFSLDCNYPNLLLQEY